MGFRSLIIPIIYIYTHIFIVVTFILVIIAYIARFIFQFMPTLELMVDKCQDWFGPENNISSDHRFGFIIQKKCVN